MNQCVYTFTCVSHPEPPSHLFLWNWNENWLFQSYGHCWVFQICWHIECSTFTAWSFRIGNNSSGIQSHPLALFQVMLLKAHLTLHSKMFGSRWVITPLWLPGSWRSLSCSSLCTLATSSKYILPLLGPYRFCPLLCPFCMKCSLGISNFLEEISSLSHSIASLYFFALITEEVFLISPCYYLKQMGISFLFVLPFTSLLFTVVCKASSHNHFAFLHFLFLGMVLITAS